MKTVSIAYKGYVVDILENTVSHKFYFVIKKGDKKLLESQEEFSFPDDADVNAKMHINNMLNKF